MSRLDRLRNEDIRERLEQEGVLGVVKRKQTNWKVRLEEMSGDRVMKRVFKGQIEGKTKRKTQPKVV